EDPDPLMPEEMEKAIKEMPRDAEVIELLKKFPPRARFLRANREGCTSSIASRCCDKPELVNLGKSDIPALYEDCN
ncbi:MAG TPA: hypothetical protein VGB09_13050, partial [Candidatus Binatia bacterium]